MRTNRSYADEVYHAVKFLSSGSRRSVILKYSLYYGLLLAANAVLAYVHRNEFHVSVGSLVPLVFTVLLSVGGMVYGNNHEHGREIKYNRDKGLAIEDTKTVEKAPAPLPVGLLRVLEFLVPLPLMLFPVFFLTENGAKLIASISGILAGLAIYIVVSVPISIVQGHRIAKERKRRTIEDKAARKKQEELESMGRFK